MSKIQKLIGVTQVAERLGCGPATVRRRAGLAKGFERDPDFPKPFIDGIGEWKWESDEVENYIDGLKARHVA